MRGRVTEAEYNGNNPQQPWIHRHGEPQRFRGHSSASMSDDAFEGKSYVLPPINAPRWRTRFQKIC